MGRKGELPPLVRQLKLVMAMLRSQQGLTIRELEEVARATRQTVYRDFGVIREAGVRILDIGEPGGVVYHRVEKTDLPKLVLTREQIEVLDAVRSRLDCLNGIRVMDVYDDLLERLGRPVQRPSATEAEERAYAIRRTVDRALHERRRLQFRFVRIYDAEARLRTVDPIGWRLCNGILYLEALDGASDERRSFAAFRMRDAELLDEESLEYDEPRFAVVNHLATLDPYDVVVQLSPVGAEHLLEHPMSDDQVATPLENGDVLLFGTVHGLVVAADWLQYWGPEAHAVEPPELVAEMCSRLERTAARYRR